MFGITPSARLRPSPFLEATLTESATALTTYDSTRCAAGDAVEVVKEGRALAGTLTALPFI